MHRLRPRATGHLRGRKAFPPYPGSAPLHHLHRPQAHHICLTAEAGQMLTAAVQSSRLCRPVHDRHTAHFWRGQGCCRRPLSRRVRHCATILRHTGRIAVQRRRVPNIPGVNHRPTAQETTNPRHYRLHLLRRICREISTVCVSSPMAPSVPVRP
jgi:hypothetical protein